MISTSITEPARFTPPWYSDEATAPVYLIRAGSVRERAQFEAEMAGPLRAGKVWGFELKAAVRDGITALMIEDPEFDRLMELVEVEKEEDLSAGDVQLLDEVRKVLAEHFGPYRDLVAQMERRRELVPVEALRRFLVDVEGGDALFTRGRDGFVAETTLAAIEPLDIMSAGNFAFTLLYGGGGLEKNSGPVASSGSDQTTSSSEAPPAAGSSVKKSGRKTRV